MSRFSDWFNEKYTVWEKAQGTPQTYMRYAAYLAIDPNVVINLMLGKALPEAGDLMVIATKEGMEAYDVIGEPRPELGVIDVFSSLGPMPTELRRCMAHAIYEAEQTVKEKNIPSGSEESKQVYTDSLERWGFRYSGDIKLTK